MSLLTEQPESSSQRIAREVLAAPSQTRDVLLNQLQDATSRLWDAPNTQEILDVIGEKAGPLFALNAQFAQIVGALLMSEGDTAGLARLQAIGAKIKPHTVNPDGTVTITPEPEPAE